MSPQFLFVDSVCLCTSFVGPSSGNTADSQAAICGYFHPVFCCLCSYYRTFPDKIKSNFLFFYFFSKHPPSKQTKKAICAYTYRPLYISTRLHTKKATSFCRLNFHIFYSCTITISRTALFHRDYHYSSVRTQVQEAPSYYADACCVVSRPAFPLPHGYRSASS